MKKSRPGVRHDCLMTPRFRDVRLGVIAFKDRPSLITFETVCFFLHSPVTGLLPLLPPGSDGRAEGDRRMARAGDRCGERKS